MAPLNLPDWIDVPLGDLARAEFGVPAVLENDATAGMLGGAPVRCGARSRHRALPDHLDRRRRGSGRHGRLHRGSAGNGGEFGHVMVRPGGRRCTCGRLGCLEAYASGTSIAARAATLLAEPARRRLSPLCPSSAPSRSSAAARAGDPLAVRAVDGDHRCASVRPSPTSSTRSNPKWWCSAAASRAPGDFLIEPVRDIVARTAMPLAAASARIEFAELGESVCVVGAAARAFDYLEEYTLVR